MRRMRRIVAFVLAVMMIAGNTVTASATSTVTTNPTVVSNENIVTTTNPDGSVVISTTPTTTEEVVEEPASSENSSETGDEVPDDGAGDVEDEPSGEEGSLSGGDEVVPPADGDDGAEVTTTTTEETTTEEITTEEETITEEETTEEETTEELLEIPMLKNTTGPTVGQNVQLRYAYGLSNGLADGITTEYYTSIADAVNAVDRIVQANPTYEKERDANGRQMEFWIELLDNTAVDDPATADTDEAADGISPTFSVSGDDMVTACEVGDACRLFLNGYTLKVTANAQTDICINGYSTENEESIISVADGATLQVLPMNTKKTLDGGREEFGNVGLESVKLQYEGTNKALILGEENHKDAESEKGVYISNVSFPEDIQITVYDVLQFSWSDNTTIGKLSIETDKGWDDSLNSYVAESVTLEGNNDTTLSIKNLTLESSLNIRGNVNVTDFTATETEAGEMALIELNNSINIENFYANDSYSVSFFIADETNSKLNISKSVTATKPIELGINTEFTEGKCIGTMPTDDADIAKKFTADGVVFDVGTHEGCTNAGSNCLYVAGEAPLLIQTYGGTVLGQAMDFAEAKELISNYSGEASGGYTVTLKHDMEASGDLNFDICEKNNNVRVNLYLEGHTLTLADDTTMAFYDISAVSYGDSQGTIKLAENKTLTLLPVSESAYQERKQMQVSKALIEFAEAGGTLVIGDVNAPGNGSVSFYDYGVDNDFSMGFANSKNASLMVYSGWSYYGGSLSTEYYVNKMTDENASDKAILQKALNFEDVQILNRTDDYCYSDVDVPIYADTMTLDGQLDVYSVSVNSLTTVGDSTMDIKETSTINSLNLGGRFEIWLNDIYDFDGNKKLTGDGAKINFGGTLTKTTEGDACISFCKYAKPLKQSEGGDYYYGDAIYKKSIIEPGEIIATVTPAEEDTAYTNTGYWRNHWLTESPQEDIRIDVSDLNKDGTYEVTAEKYSDKIWLYNHNTNENIGFDTLEAVKNRIIRTDNADYEYSINLNSNVTLEGDDLDYSSVNAKAVYLNLENYIVTVNSDSTVAVNHVNGNIWNESTGVSTPGGNSKFNLNAGVTLILNPRSNENGDIHTCYDDVIFASSNTNKPGSIVLGSDDIDGRVELIDVKLTNKIGDLKLYADTYVKLAAAATVNHLYVENADGQGACVEGAYLLTATNYTGKGYLDVNKLKVSNTATVDDTKCINVLPAGSVEINKLVVNTTGDTDDMGNTPLFNIKLKRVATLAEDDNFYYDSEADKFYAPTFEGATYGAFGNVKITGTVTSENQIFVYRVNYYSKEYEENGNYYVETGESSVPFSENDLVLTATNAEVTANKFWIDNSHDWKLIPVKVGSEIRIGKQLVSIEHMVPTEYDEYGNCIREDSVKSASYISLEEAIKNMAADFDSISGKYVFNFYGDVKLTANMTLPSFVESAVFNTEHIQMDKDNGVIWVPTQQILDLNGKTLTTYGELHLGNGLRVTSSVATAGTIKRTGSGSLAVDIYDSWLVDADGKWLVLEEEKEELTGYVGAENISTATRMPALDNVKIEASGYDVRIGDAQRICDIYRGEGEYPNVPLAVELDADINTNCLYIDTWNTNWNIDGNVTVSDYFELNSSQTTKMSNLTVNGWANISGQLEANDITLKKVSRDCGMSIRPGGNVVAKNVTLNNAELVIENDNIRWDEALGADVDNFVTMDNITMTGSRLVVRSSTEWYTDDAGNDQLGICRPKLVAKKITMATSKLCLEPAWVEEDIHRPDLDIETITVNSAYAADTMGDYTIDNGGLLTVDTVNMKAGTFANGGTVVANTLNVKDYVAWENTDTITNVLVNTGKITLNRNSKLFIGGKTATVNGKVTDVISTLNNVAVVGYDEYEEELAIIGRSEDAKVTFKGSFTVENEGQLVGMFVADSNVAEGQGVIRTDEYGGIWIQIETGSADDDGNLTHEPSPNVKGLVKDSELFNLDAGLKAFPVESVRVLNVNSKDYWSTDAVYHDGNTLKVTGNYVMIFALYADGNINEEPVAQFSSWADASAYLATLNNPSTAYEVRICIDELNVGKLELPKNVKSILIGSGLGEETGGNWIPEKVTLTFTGDITLNSDTVFENIALKSDTSAAVKAGGKFLAFVRTDLLTTDDKGNEIQGAFKSLSGDKNTIIDIVGSDIAVTSNVTGLKSINLYEGSTLNVTGNLGSAILAVFDNSKVYTTGTITVDELIGNDFIPNDSEETENYVKATKAITVKEILSMSAPTTLESADKITLKDVYSNNPGNVLKTATANKITISGRVLADNDHIAEAWNKVTVVAVEETTEDKTKVLGYDYTEENQDVTEKATREIMPFAVTLDVAGAQDGSTLAVAEKVSPIWFITPGDSTEDGTLTWDLNLARKSGKNILFGAEATHPISLSVKMGEDRMEELNTFATLQEAFDEIDKVASPSMNYVITLEEDIEVQAKGNLADLKFPKQAAEVEIAALNEDTQVSITYKKDLTINSNVKFTNIYLNAKTSGGTIKLGNFTLTMEDSNFDEEMLNEELELAYNITGGGVGKGSKFVFKNSLSETLIINGKVSAVDEFKVDSSTVMVMGDTTVGTLDFPDDGEIFLNGEVTITDIKSSGGLLGIVPKLTFNKDNTVKSIAENATVLGNVDGGIQIALCSSIDSGDSVEVLDDVSGLDTLLESGSVPFVKAVNVGVDKIVLANAFAQDGGTIFKNKGVMTYKEADAYVTLEYYDEVTETPVSTPCESIADAVAEINNLKVKREYSICINQERADNTPDNLTMPDGKYVDKLWLKSNIEEVIESDSEGTVIVPATVYYTGSLKFNFDTAVENIEFVKVEKVGNAYYPVDGADYASAKGANAAYAATTTVNVSGAYTLDIYGTVTFNTPIALTGSNKAVLNVMDMGVLEAYADNDKLPENAYAENGDIIGCVIQGSIKDFAQVNVVDQVLYVTGYSSGKLSADKPTYKKAELNVTELNISGTGAVYVGSGDIVTGAESYVLTDTVKVTTLNVKDNAALISSGTLEIKNATLSDNVTVGAYGQSFKVTGTLTSTTDQATLLTGLDSKYASALNVANVALEEADDRVNVKVVAVYETVNDKNEKSLIVEDMIKLGSEELTIKKNATTEEIKTISAKLLTSQKADARAFLADSDCVGGNGSEVGEFDKVNNTDGYILKKTGNDVLVNYAEDVKVILYKSADIILTETESADEVVNYYTDINEAFAAIDAFKDAKAYYGIELLDDIGGYNAATEKTEYVDLKLPKQAEVLTIFTVSSKDTPYKIYYSKNLSLQTSTRLYHIGLVSEESRGVYKSIDANKHTLSVNNLADSTIGALKGTSVITIKDSSITATDVVSVNRLWLENATMTTKKAAVVSDLILINSNGASSVQAENTLTIARLYGEGTDNILEYQDVNGKAGLTINGEVSGSLNSITLKNKTEKKVITADKDGKYTLAEAAKLANVNSAAQIAGIVTFVNAGTELADDAYAWANKGIYLLSENVKPTVVKVGSTDKAIAVMNCLDLTQAAAYIDLAADKELDYTIALPDGVSDTDLTKDGARNSAIKLPSKDKFATVRILGATGSELAFKGDITANGNVTFEDVAFRNENAASFNIKSVKDKAGNAKLILDNVKTAEKDASGKEPAKNIAIKGEKNISNIIITDSPDVNYTSITAADSVMLNAATEAYNAMAYNVAAMSDVNTLITENATLTSTGVVKAGTFVLGANGGWIVKNTATVDDIDSSAQTANSAVMIGQNASGVPYLTVNKDVTNAIAVMPMNADGTQPLDPGAKKLVKAPVAAADKFIAYVYSCEEGGNQCNFDEATNTFLFATGRSVNAYKDAAGYVYNGDISLMQVILSELGEDGTALTETYVKTYAEAIAMIDTAAKADANYQITLRNTGASVGEDGKATGGNDGIIKTAVKNGEAIFGKLTLPAAKKAASLVIKGDDNAANGIIMKYSGKIQPNCDLTLENMELTEAVFDGTGSKVTKEYGYINPSIKGVTLTIGKNVSVIPNGDNVAAMGGLKDFDLVFKEVSVTASGKVPGILDISGHKAYSDGKVTVDTMQVSKDQGIAEGQTAILASKKAIEFNNIVGEGTLEVHTTYANTKDWTLKDKTQFTVKGECDKDAIINLAQYVGIYNTDIRKIYGYSPLSAEELKALCYDGGTPDNAKNLITAPKLPAENVRILALDKAIANTEDEAAKNAFAYNTLKYKGGVYITDKELPITVEGRPYGDGENIPKEASYTAQFFTWEEAVAEIDKLNHLDKKNPGNSWVYAIILHDSLGKDGEPLKTFKMPTKAAYVAVMADENVENVGIATTATSVNLGTDAGFNVPIAAVKASAGNYYSAPYSIKLGNYELELDQVPTEVEISGTGYFEPQMKLEGSAKSILTINTAVDWTSMFRLIKGIGTVTLNATERVYEDNSTEIGTNLYVEEGISGINNLTINPGMRVESPVKDVTVKNLVIGAPRTDIDNSDFAADTEAEKITRMLECSNDLRGDLYAKNITVSDTLIMASASLSAGTTKAGDGKITLNNVVFNDYCNDIYGKQDNKGNTQIWIKGQVNGSENIIDSHSTATIGLFYNNTTKNFVQLTEGMNLLKAPKVAASWFRPAYDYDYEVWDENGPVMDDSNNTVMATQRQMGPEIGAETTMWTWDSTEEKDVPQRNDDGTVKTEWVPLFELIKSGDFIKYSRVRESFEGEYEGTKLPMVNDLAEVRLHIGISNPDDWEKASSITYMTFEEAVKAIDSMNLTEKDENGKSKNISYVIELLRDVEIGNEKNDNNYKALTLPSKAFDLTIQGNGHSMTFTGNVTAKCNTTFRDMNLRPVKLVKNELVPAEVNLVAGNFKVTWNCSSLITLDENGEWTWNDDLGFANITGSAKGELVIGEDSYLKANNVTGFNVVSFVDKENGNNHGMLRVIGQVNVKEIHYEENAVGLLDVVGNITINGVQVVEGATPIIVKNDDKTMKVNGIKMTEKDAAGKNVTWYETVVGTSQVMIITLPTKTDTVLPGTLIMNGKYLDVAEWQLLIPGENAEVECNAYQVGNDIFIGTPVPQN